MGFPARYLASEIALAEGWDLDLPVRYLALGIAPAEGLDLG